MMTQIEFYDKDVIKNVLGVLSLKPDKVVYIYDSELKDMNRFKSLEKCLKNHLPEIVLEKYPVDILDIDGIYKTTLDVIEKNDRCVIELTGGSELMTIAGYKAGNEKGVEMIYTDIIRNRVIDIVNKENIRKTEKMTITDFVDAKGAMFIGNSHDEPEEKEYDDILHMCSIIFRNLKKWRTTCAFFQTAMADTAPDDLCLDMRLSIAQKDGRWVSPNKDLLYNFQRFGFIRELQFTSKNVYFRFVSKTAKTYLTNYGIWLELYVFINAKKTGAFDDVHLGLMIDWDAYDGITVSGNEIDVILTDNSMPVFISCKLRAADTAAINELVIEKKRIGGWFSKSILVSFGEDKKNRTGTYKRAVEMGVEFLGMEDILSDDFAQRLLRTVKGHDLISLKWRKV